MLEYLNKNNNLSNDDYFILAQATSPFTLSTNVNEALDILEKNKNFDSLLSGVNFKRFLWDYNTNLPINYNYKKRPRRQDFNGYFMENGAFYISKIKNILQSQNRISGSIYMYEMDEVSSLEIDEEIDWEIAEHFVKNINQKK